MKQHKRRLITEATVRAAARDGSVIQLGRDDIVTPAARDAARACGIALRTETLHEAPPAVVALGADHGGFVLKESLKPAILDLGFAVNDVGCSSTDPVDYPVFAARVADLVAEGKARFGIMVDGAGIGSAMVANKIAGVRAACCHDLASAKNAREHNDANVLTLGGPLAGERLAVEVVSVFLTASFAGGRHERRVAMIRALDGSR